MSKHEVYKKQPRDLKGHFQTYDGSTRPRYYTEKKIHELIKAAFMAGLNNQSGLFSPAKKIEMYLRSIK